VIITQIVDIYLISDILAHVIISLAVFFVGLNVPIRWNNGEFILAPFKYDEEDIQTLQIYNVDGDSWRRGIEYSTTETSTDLDLVINDNDGTLMTYDFEGNLTTFDMDKQTANHVNIKDVGSDPQCVILDDQLHIIGGYNSNKHYIYNPNTNELEEMYEFQDLGFGVYEHRLCHIKSQNRLLLFGGKKFGELMDKMWEYQIDNKLWKKLDIKLPRPCRKMGTLLTMNERYLIMNLFWQNINDICFPMITIGCQ